MDENEIQEYFFHPQIKFTSQDIRNMNPRDFEVFMANIFSDNGYSITITKYTCYGGKDIIIKKNGITFYVECKHWESAVGRPELQKLVGATVGSAVSDLIFISTGGFNVNAMNYVC
ncbi:MAG: restriction endonuclease [Selenomonadaceae bacterium]|nr:restriction endonuclease [Selenomonadaceae bacterium]